MKCSICKLEGHNKRSCKETVSETIQDQPIIKRRANSIDFYTNASILPSTADTYWLIYGKCGDIHGKWMLFYDKTQIDKEWANMKKLYDECKLGDVISMKCSGAKENPRVSNKNQHVIIIYSAENDIMSIGKSIIENIVDYSKPYIYYKTNIQTGDGTRATGQDVNHLYKLPIKGVDTKDTSCYRVGGPSRREMKNIVSKEGYCRCGRKDEDGSYGCSSYPSCVDDAWY
jgi:hypothetical protein